MKEKIKAKDSVTQVALLNEIDSKRAAIDSIKGELEWLDVSPVPPADLRARVKSHVDQLAQRYLAMAPVGTVRSPHSGIEAVSGLLDYGVTETIHGRRMMGPFVSWLLGDALVDKICSAAEVSGDDVCGPSLPERRLAIEQLRKDLYDTECREEALICQADEVGLKVARRADADPMAVLGFDPNGSMSIVKTGRLTGGNSVGIVGGAPAAAVVQNL